MLIQKPPLTLTKNEAYKIAAEKLGADSRRYRHSLGVQERIDDLIAATPFAQNPHLHSVGIVHDIGYAEPATGMHALDGAFILESLGYGQAATLVAHHSTSAAECYARDLHSVLEEFGSPDPVTHSILWVADFTTTPDGALTSLTARMREIATRYSPDSSVYAALEVSRPVLAKAVELLAAHGLLDTNDSRYSLG